MTQQLSAAIHSTEPILRIDGIVKSFGKVVANKGVSFDVRPGEVHCLLGENGAGKTVLMSILYGMFQPDAGTITYKGRPLAIHSPKDAIQHRIGMVHQHFMLVPTLTVAENVVLGQHRPWSVLNDMPQVAEKIRELGKDLGFEVDPDALVENLSVGEQQRVEILKTMYHGADLLILDEPTAVLTPQETLQLLHLLRGLADRGLTIIFITHKLEEVMQVSDRVTVLRDGRVIATVNTPETNPRELARMMVGREVLMTLPRTAYKPGEPVLEVEGDIGDERAWPGGRARPVDLRPRARDRGRGRRVGQRADGVGARARPASCPRAAAGSAWGARSSRSCRPTHWVTWGWRTCPRIASRWVLSSPSRLRKT